MNTATLLHQMCQDVLSQADMNAIGKNRGFSRQEIATRTLLENFYLAPIGVEAVLKSLTLSEIAMLHLLHDLREPVSIEVFERLYNPDFLTKRTYYGGTPTQRYQPVFKQIRTKLVRKGLLLMGLSPRTDSTKMERWRFMFPTEFAVYLPRPMAEVHRLNGPGKIRRDAPRKKLLGLVGQAPKPNLRLDNYPLTLEDGQLYLGKRPFQAADLQKWQKERWQATTPGPIQTDKKRAPYLPQPKGEKRSVLEALTYTLKLLHTDEWVASEQLNTVITLFCNNKYDVNIICRLGWEWGLLAQNKDDQQTVYRFAALVEPAKEDRNPADYLTMIDDQSVHVNLQNIPYQALEQISQAAYISIQNNELVATANVICMGRAAPEILQSRPLQWLFENVPDFAQTNKTVQSRRGKQIVHTNLQIARVKDFGLRIKIERTLKPNELVVLSDEYIAFSPKALAKVKKIVTQAGQVVKFVSSEK